MPNHISNILHIDAVSEERRQEIKLALQGKNEDGELVVVDIEKFFPTPDDCDWYHWRIANWGTKWNTYSGEDCGDSVCFLTAWASPFPAIMKISEFFPDAVFKVVFADEDASYNCGEYHIRNGEVIFEHYPEGGSDEAWEVYFECHDWARDEYVKDSEGHWVWRDDSETPLF